MLLAAGTVFGMVALVFKIARWAGGDQLVFTALILLGSGFV